MTHGIGVTWGVCAGRSELGGAVGCAGRTGVGKQVGAWHHKQGTWGRQHGGESWGLHPNRKVVGSAAGPNNIGVKMQCMECRDLAARGHTGCN